MMVTKMAAKMKKYLEDLCNAIRTPLSRPTALSYIVYCAMDRLLLLEIAGVPSRNDAHADVVSWVHRDADEGIICGCAAHCSLRGSPWHRHKQVDLCIACMPSHYNSTAPIFTLEWRQDDPAASKRRQSESTRLRGSVWTACSRPSYSSRSASRRRCPTSLRPGKELRPLYGLVSEERWEPANGGQ